MPLISAVARNIATALQQLRQNHGQSLEVSRLQGLCSVLPPSSSPNTSARTKGLTHPQSSLCFKRRSRKGSKRMQAVNTHARSAGNLPLHRLHLLCFYSSSFLLLPVLEIEYSAHALNRVTQRRLETSQTKGQGPRSADL